MRAVESLLTAEPQTIDDLAGRVYGLEAGDLTRSQVESVRRAAKRLAELGRAELQRYRGYRLGKTPPRAFGRGSNPSFLAVRTLRTEEERARDRERALELHRRIVAALRA